ncbi:hypothetical protein PUN28_000135 [Cardiocondyla obscurior]|uniref:Secreted protein n=1 Tax=Cardiocondyla obscurior TaxID=286306 RepID=A0AAW2GYE2_9HYME
MCSNRFELIFFFFFTYKIKRYSDFLYILNFYQRIPAFTCLNAVLGTLHITKSNCRCRGQKVGDCRRNKGSDDPEQPPRRAEKGSRAQRRCSAGILSPKASRKTHD